MFSAATLRRQIEAALQSRIPSALTPRPRNLRETAPTGETGIDALLGGGMPVGAITELVGPPCSGRTTLALATLAGLTAEGRMVAWVDASDTFDPESAAAVGLDLRRQLWVRCGGDPATQNTTYSRTHEGAALLVPGSRTAAPSGGGGSPHPRSEARGLSEAVNAFMRPNPFTRSFTPRGNGSPENRPNLRKDRIVGTPGAPNRKLPNPSTTNLPSTHTSFPRAAPEREEQVASDRLPPRRGANLNLPQRLPKTLPVARIANTAAAANTPGAASRSWTDNRNNAAGRALKTAPSAIAAGLPGSCRPAEGTIHQIPTIRPCKPDIGSPKDKDPQTSLAGTPPANLARAATPLWKALDQALRSTDLILAGGGFSAVVLDLGSIAPEFTWRIPLATWFRFRAAAERSRAVFLVLTQHPSARSAAELVLRLSATQPQSTATILTGTGFHLAVDRQRFETEPAPPPQAPTSTSPDQLQGLHLVARKSPQRERAIAWQRSAAWARS